MYENEMFHFSYCPCIHKGTKVTQPKMIYTLHENDIEAYSISFRVAAQYNNIPRGATNMMSSCSKFSEDSDLVFNVAGLQCLVKTPIDNSIRY
jgi:hypothetical protein